MKKQIVTVTVLALLGLFTGCVDGDKDLTIEETASTVVHEEGHVVAVGIKNAGAIRQVGPFLDSGHDSPFALNPLFISYKADGQVLGKNRLLVGSTSNFGAPDAANGHLPGAIISISTESNDTIEVSSDFASTIGNNNVQPAEQNGLVRMYSCNNDVYANYHNRPEAATANYTAVSYPTGISINNAFGRPWISNAPEGITGGGSSTVVDPDGKPLEAKLSAQSGGAFVGGLSERSPQVIEGSLTEGSVGTGFMGVSPKNDIRADFAMVNSDGSIAQVHVAEGIDGLAPANTITPLTDELSKSINDQDINAITRVGVLFNWVGAEGKVLYVSDPLGNRIAVLKLSSDNTVFKIKDDRVEYFTSTDFNTPIDLAPTTPEFANGDFSSGTTLAAGADMYVANRGDNTIVRIDQTGKTIAKKSVIVDGIGTLNAQSTNKINGISTSWDATRIYVTVSGTHPDYPRSDDGFVVVLDAFGFE
ncbi:MAG: hypothetical protein K0U47_00695 [Epsilonproteobacteria bacterium]|nr:hypothetical protein [Campylobacterota bacterium]